MRDYLANYVGQRVRYIARCVRFSRRSLGGENFVVTVLLEDVIVADTGEKVADHIWSDYQEWGGVLIVGDVFQFTAIAQPYEKLYHKNGKRLQSWRLSRPRFI